MANRSVWRAVALLAVVAAVLALVPLAVRSDAAPPSPTPRSRATSDDLEDRFLSTRPPVGPAWKVNLGGSTNERLMMRTLQGVVNRTSARLYLMDPGDSGANRWIDEYQDRGLVTVAGTTDVAGALDLFAGEASGYVLATDTEPWTINAAATIAAAEGAVVATPELVAALESRGLTLIEDVRGRWADASTAYSEIAAEYYDRLPHKGIAVLRPSDSLFDFTIQQGMMTVFTRPSDPSWEAVSDIITGLPEGQVVYGYLSDTGDEEAVAVGTLSEAGLVLVPTDTTRNLSFQIAVGADQPRVPMTAPDVADVAPCEADTLNVVVGITDGDNINVPLSNFSRPAMWPSPRRGELPVGWSMGSSLAILAPAAWDTYAMEATPNDEVVSIIGYAYGSPALLPDAAGFYEDSFALMDELGMQTFWSLGGGLETPSAPGWAQVDAAAGEGVPNGLLVGYGNGSGVGDAFYSPAGRPAFTSGTSYTDTPAAIAAQVEALQARPSDERPLVSFISATNWSNPMAELFDALAPFEAEGVRFLTPAEATACTPPAPDDPDSALGPSDCLPGEPLTEGGIALISATVVGEITSVPTHVEIPTVLTATPSVGAGGVIDYELRATIDLPALAQDVLENRVRPIVAAGYGPALAESAWIRMTMSQMTLRVALDPELSRVPGPAVSSSGPPASFWWQDGGISIVVAPFAEDTEAPGEPFEVVTRWQMAADAPTDAREVTAVTAATTFDLLLTVGVQLGEGSLFGSVAAPWLCEPSEIRASTMIDAAPLVSTTTTTSAPSSTTAPPSLPAPVEATPIAPVTPIAPAFTG